MKVCKSIFSPFEVKYNDNGVQKITKLNKCDRSIAITAGVIGVIFGVVVGGVAFFIAASILRNKMASKLNAQLNMSLQQPKKVIPSPVNAPMPFIPERDLDLVIAEERRKFLDNKPVEKTSLESLQKQRKNLVSNTNASLEEWQAHTLSALQILKFIDSEQVDSLINQSKSHKIDYSELKLRYQITSGEAIHLNHQPYKFASLKDYCERVIDNIKRLGSHSEKDKENIRILSSVAEQCELEIRSVQDLFKTLLDGLFGDWQYENGDKFDILEQKDRESALRIQALAI